ncbi:MAG: TadE family protein, partial [Gemmatimonadales bacterium]
MFFSNRLSKVAGSARRTRRGGAMIELAVAMPLLVLICIGVMDLGRVYFTSVAVANAARAGAEYSLTYPQTTPYQTANQISFAKLDAAEAGAITVTASTACKCGSTAVTCNSTPDCGGGFGVP